LRDTETPGAAVSTMKSEIPRLPDPGAVCTTQVRKSARRPLVMNSLRAVDDPAVAVADAPGADPGDVGAGVGLGDRDRPDLLAGDRGAE